MWLFLIIKLGSVTGTSGFGCSGIVERTACTVIPFSPVLQQPERELEKQTNNYSPPSWIFHHLVYNVCTVFKKFCLPLYKYTALPTTPIKIESSLIFLDIGLPQCLMQSRGSINTG